MEIKNVTNVSYKPNFGVVTYDKAGLSRLNKKLGSNAKDFIDSQKYNNTADIALTGDKVEVKYKDKSYEMQDYRKTEFETLILEDDSHFHVNDGKSGFDISPTDYPMYLDHLLDHLITVPYNSDGKKGLFVTNTIMDWAIDYGKNNIEYANAQEMASHINKFEIAHVDVNKRMLNEDNSWAEAYEAMKQKRSLDLKA